MRFDLCLVLLIIYHVGAPGPSEPSDNVQLGQLKSIVPSEPSRRTPGPSEPSGAPEPSDNVQLGQLKSIVPSEPSRRTPGPSGAPDNVQLGQLKSIVPSGPPRKAPGKPASSTEKGQDLLAVIKRLQEKKGIDPTELSTNIFTPVPSTTGNPESVAPEPLTGSPDIVPPVPSTTGNPGSVAPEPLTAQGKQAEGEQGEGEQGEQGIDPTGLPANIVPPVQSTTGYPDSVAPGRSTRSPAGNPDSVAPETSTAQGKQGIDPTGLSANIVPTVPSTTSLDSLKNLVMKDPTTNPFIKLITELAKEEQAKGTQAGQDVIKMLKMKLTQGKQVPLPVSQEGTRAGQDVINKLKMKLTQGKQGTESGTQKRTAPQTTQQGGTASYKISKNQK